MSATVLKRKLARLESQAAGARAVTVPPAPLTPDEAAHRIEQLLATWRARQQRLEAAQTSTDPRERAWARRVRAQAAAISPEERAEVAAQFAAMLARSQALGILTAGPTRAATR